MFSERLRRPRATQSTASKLAAVSSGPVRLRSRAAAAGLLIGLATLGLALAPSAALAASGTYSAAISPNVAQAGASATFTTTFTNQSSTAEITRVVVHVPTGFTVTGVGVPTPDSWTVGHSGNEVSLFSGVLEPGGSVSIPITATAPTTPGLYKWATSATGPGATFTRLAPDPSVNVAQAAAVVTCSPGASCSSPTLSVGASPTALATDSQVTAQPGSQPDQLTVVLPDPTAAPLLCEQTGGNFGQIVTWNVTTRTSTLVYTVHPTNPLYVYDLSDACFGSTQPFPGAVQNPANGNEYEGTLPYCSVQTAGGPVTNPPPCVDSIVTTRHDPEAVAITVHAPLGDPKFTG